MFGATLVVSGCYQGYQDETVGSGSDAGTTSPGGEGSGPDAEDSGDESGGEFGSCEDRSLGSAPIRRLTPFELDNTLFDLLGDDTHPASGLPEEGGSGFDNNAEVGAVSRLVAQKYMQLSEDVAIRATADLPGLLGCSSADDAACLRAFPTASEPSQMLPSAKQP